MWGVAAMQWLSPDTFALAAVLCMTFPVFLLFNLLFIPFWLIVRLRYIWIPLLGIAVCGGSIYSYYPFFNHDNGEDSWLKVLIYNTYSWGRDHGMNEGDNLVVRWCIDQNADILILQEVNMKEERLAPLRAAGYKILRPANTVATEAIATRLTVIDFEKIELPTLCANGAMIAHLLHEGDTIAVISAHLESFHLKPDEIEEYQDIIAHPTGDGTKTRSKNIIKRIMPALGMHGSQADVLLDIARKEIEQNHHVIIGGDFNDVPNSYAVATMRSLLTDCFRESGYGVGFTFNEQMMFFRIDHLFCSPSLRPLRTYIDKSITYSDHYPVITEFAK